MYEHMVSNLTLGYIRHIPWAIVRDANGIEIHFWEINGSWHHVHYLLKILAYGCSHCRLTVLDNTTELIRSGPNFAA